MIKLLPSLISAPLLELKTTINKLETYAYGFHLDLMDFHFVPNLTWGPAFVNAIAQETTRPLQVHLMVDQPQHYLDRLALRQKDVVSVHYESLPYAQLVQTLGIIKKNGWIPSLAINPTTAVATVEPLLPFIEHCLLMSVTPGFSGQAFIPESVQRLQEVVALRAKHHATFKICMDGGIGKNNIQKLAKLGMDQAAVASAIFNTTDSVEALRELSRSP
jgi:ribulose-phosphate 3-epimerase